MLLLRSEINSLGLLRESAASSSTSLGPIKLKASREIDIAQALSSIRSKPATVG